MACELLKQLLMYLNEFIVNTSGTTAYEKNIRGTVSKIVT